MIKPLPKNLDLFHAPLCPAGPIDDGPCACPVAIAKDLHEKASNYEKALKEIIEGRHDPSCATHDCEGSCERDIAKRALGEG